MSFTYDAQGHVLTITDAKNNVTTNTYDSKGNLSTSQVTGFPPSSYQYDANGNRIQQIDPAGVETDSVYDSSGNLTSQTVAVGKQEAQTTTYIYDSNGNKTSETKNSSAGNLTTLYQYDAKNRLEETIYPDGNNTQTTYDSLGHTVGTQDQKGRVTSYFFDMAERQNKVQYPDLTTQVFVYDAASNRTSVTDRGGRTTTTAYDALNRPTTVTYQDGSRTITNYDGQGHETSKTDENNHKTFYQYDQAGRKTQMTDALSHTTVFGYDANDNETSVMDANNHTTGFVYDAMNRQTQVNYQDGTFTVTGYDNDGRKTSFKDQGTNTTNYTLDGLGRLVQVQDAMGHVTALTYDQQGNELTQEDANSHTTIFSYDNMNRRVSRTLPDGHTKETYTYDARGNMVTKTTFNGNTITYGYDINDHLTGETGPGVNITYQYDQAGDRVVMNDASGATTFNHDSRDRQVAKVSPFGTLDYGRDRVGNLTSTTSSNTNGTNVVYTPDVLNRLSGRTEGTRQSTYTYDNGGNLNTVTLGNGLPMTYNYNTVNQLTSMTVGSILGYSYTLGPTGIRTAVNEQSGRSVSYSQDAIYRETGEQIVTDPNGNQGMVGYTYDNTGNRQQRTSSVSIIPMQNFTGTYNSDDQIGGSGFTWDGDGNMLTDNQGRTYTYNTLDQLTRVTGTNLDVNYLYDGDGLRVAKTNNLTGVTTNYLWDTQNYTDNPQVLEELQNGQVTTRYGYGLYLESEDRFGANAGTNFYARDGQGSVRALTDSSGNITDQYDEDSFGNLIHQSGANTPNAYLFDSEFRDSDNGLIYLRARWYDADLGRFASMDSYMGDPNDPRTLNKYMAFADDGINMYDPMGKEFSLPEISISTAIEATLATNALTTLAGGAFAVANGAKLSAVGLTWSTKDANFGSAITGNASFTMSYDFGERKPKFYLSGNVGLNPMAIR